MSINSSSVILTSTVGARREGPLAVGDDVHNLVHADELLDLRGDLGAQARYVHPVDHVAAGLRRRDLRVGRKLHVVLAVGHQVLRVLVAVGRRWSVGRRRRRPRCRHGHGEAKENQAHSKQPLHNRDRC